jgi:hypothetical protein
MDADDRLLRDAVSVSCQGIGSPGLVRHTNRLLGCRLLEWVVHHTCHSVGLEDTRVLKRSLIGLAVPRGQGMRASSDSRQDF